MMRFMQVFFAGTVLCCAVPSWAQGEWITYTSMEDNFRVHVPGEFRIEETTWDSEYGAVMPARTYLYEHGDGSTYNACTPSARGAPKRTTSTSIGKSTYAPP
jgi:hypothetical protein